VAILTDPLCVVPVQSPGHSSAMASVKQESATCANSFNSQSSYFVGLTRYKRPTFPVKLKSSLYSDDIIAKNRRIGHSSTFSTASTVSIKSESSFDDSPGEANVKNSDGLSNA
jgi:hypothetical protein